MDKSPDRMKFSTLLPWFIILMLVLALIFVMAKNPAGEKGVFETVIREDEIVSSLRVNLLRAAEAEKSAVLAITDEESRKFADQARLAAAAVEKARKELTPLVEQDHSAKETALIAEFDQCWTEFQKLDQRLLDLAVQNTNLHAANLALTKGTEAINRLEGHLTRLIDSSTSGGENGRVVKLSYQALVAGFKIHDLYTPHIKAETDEQMDQIEKNIRANEEIMKNSLNELAGRVQGKWLDQVKEAKEGYAELAGITNTILVLSRKNTNIKSLDLSLGKKRLITAQCDEVLKTLQELIRSRETKATR
jgi:hypothetical protein